MHMEPTPQMPQTNSINIIPSDRTIWKNNDILSFMDIDHGYPQGAQRGQPPTSSWVSPSHVTSSPSRQMEHHRHRLSLGQGPSPSLGWGPKRQWGAYEHPPHIIHSNYISFIPFPTNNQPELLVTRTPFDLWQKFRIFFWFNINTTWFDWLGSEFKGTTNLWLVNATWSFQHRNRSFWNIS